MLEDLDMFLQLLLVNIKIYAAQKVRLAVLFFAVIGISVMVGLVGSYFLNEVGFNAISIAIVDLDDGFETQMILSALADDSQASSGFNFVRFSAEDAQAALDSGGVAAVITFPENFGNSMIIGENIPFTIVYNNERPLASALVQIAAEAFADMLRSSQMGVYVTLNFAREQDISPAQFDMILMAVNMRFLNIVMNRTEMFFPIMQDDTAGFTIWESYFITVYFALILCVTFIMTGALRQNFNRLCIKRLKVQKVSAFSIWSACFAVGFLLIAVINLAVGLWFFGFSSALLLAMVIISMVFAAFAAMLVFFNDFTAGVFSAVFVGLSLFLSGGIIPVDFFSENLRIISGIVFNTWAVRLVSGENIVASSVAIFVFSFIFFIIGYCSVLRKGRT